MATHPGRVPVRLVSDLCAAALKQKQDKELALWYCLRQLNVTGCGRISLEDATDGLIKIFGYSRRTVFRHLVLGEGRYWERFSSMRGHQIRIYALERPLCSTFGLHLGQTLERDCATDVHKPQ